MQHVDVCMFSNGKFKNVVADEHISEPLGPDTRFNRTFELQPVRTPTKNWIAVEGALFNSSAAEVAGNWGEQTQSRLAPSSPPELKATEDRNVFAIYVSYYVKVKLTLSGMGGEVSLKLPFLLGHVDADADQVAEEGDVDVVAVGAERKGGSGGSVLAKSSRVVVAAEPSSHQCEVISELCEMSLSNNNVSTEDHHRRTSGCQSIKDNNGNGSSHECGSYRNSARDVEEDEAEEGSPLGRGSDRVAVPVISVATVQVHVVSNSNHSSRQHGASEDVE